MVDNYALEEKETNDIDNMKSAHEDKSNTERVSHSYLNHFRSYMKKNLAIYKMWMWR